MSEPLSEPMPEQTSEQTGEQRVSDDTLHALLGLVQAEAHKTGEADGGVVKVHTAAWVTLKAALEDRHGSLDTMKILPDQTEYIRAGDFWVAPGAENASEPPPDGVEVSERVSTLTEVVRANQDALEALTRAVSELSQTVRTLTEAS